MARIISFADTSTLKDWIARSIGREHRHLALPASQLTNTIRAAIRDFAPDIVLLELNSTINNAYLYFFLRADQATSDTPIILVSDSTSTDLYTHVFDAEGGVQRLFNAHQIADIIAQHLPRERAAGTVAA